MSAEQGTILCVESSGQNCGVALVRAGRVVSSFSHWISNIHDRLLATMCSQILSANEIQVHELNAIALSAGPGSFTGLRIGASFVKALCFDNQPKLLGLPTLEAFALSAATRSEAGQHSGIVVIVAAQTGKFYVQHFDAQARSVSAAQLLNETDVTTSIPKNSFIVGPAAHRFGSIAENDPLARLHAEHLVPLSMQYYLQERWAAAESFVPLYVQDFVPQMSPQEYLQ